MILKMTAASLMLLAGLAHAEIEHTCRAQCVYLDEATQTIDFGQQVEGESTYSKSEAFTDMAAKCKAPYLLAQSMAGRVHQKSYSIAYFSRYRVRGFRYIKVSEQISYYRVMTENDFEFDIRFASYGSSCISETVDPSAPRKYSGSGEPLGG